MPFFPPTGGGGPGLVDGKMVYVSPTGSDSNDGSSWERAMLTGYNAYDRLADSSAGLGGELHFIDLTSWGGPVADQGCWLRDDALSPPGWQPLVPLRLIGHGGVHTQFGQPGARLIGGITNPVAASGRFKPLLWLAGSSAKPVVYQNVLPAGASYNCNQPGRFGWDYRRSADSSIKFNNILEWDRADGQAVLTLELPEGITITNIARTHVGSVITTRINFAAQAAMPSCYPGQKFYLTSSSGDFPSGAYQVSAYSTAGTWIEYLDVGADASAGAVGNWQAHAIQRYDRIEVIPTDNEIANTSYRVVDTTYDTITVTDPYGYAPRSATVTVEDAGTCVVQDRFWYGVGLLDIVNVGGQVSPSVGTDQFGPGPTLDFGTTTDGRITVNKGCPVGYVPTVPCSDPDRAAWLLADGGAYGAAGLEVSGLNPGGTGMRIYGSKYFQWAFAARQVRGDTQIGVTAPPQLEVLEGGSYGQVIAEEVLTWDNDASAPNVRIEADADTADIKRCGLVEVNGVVNTSGWDGQAESAITKGQVGFWAGRVNADLPQARRQFNLTTPRYWNFAQNDPATWDLQGGQVTATACAGPQYDPTGGTDPATSLLPAWRMERISGSDGVYVLPQDTDEDPHTTNTFTHAVGDRWVIGIWARADNGLPGGSILSFNMAGNNGNFSIVCNASQFYGDGEWQWLAAGGTIETVNVANSGIRFILTAGAGMVGSEIDVMDPLLIRIPNGDMTDNEFAEYLLSVQSTPYYLRPGLAGTRPGQKFIAHGGIGGASETGVTLEGTANGVVVPYHDTDGSLLGYLPLYDEA